TRADAHVRKDDGALDVAALVDANVREQKRLVDVSTRDDAAPGHDRIDRHAAAPVFVQHELRGRVLALIGPNGPLLVIYIELWIDVHELHVRFVERIDGPDIAPVVLYARLHVGERIGKHLQGVERLGN